ncbi:MAG: SDR family oxidoreductase [Acidobacteria bacterium]|nr:SDR family oxidoreductase [Acidobacteriota bacterium]
MAIFLTGSTGYVGSHVAAGLLERSEEPLYLLVRAKDDPEAEERLWRALQIHFDFPRFHHYLRTRISLFRGSLADPHLGLPPDHYRRLAGSTTSVIHCAASLNRKSERACLNVNLRGTLEVVQLAMRAHEHHGLHRFSHVSTVAVAGERANEIVQEDRAIEWDRADYDPYARTKKFCEHMIRQLLPDVPRTIFRPSIVLGHSRHAETTQFDMVRAFVFLAGLPILPFRPTDRLDIVPVDFVSDSIVTLHQKERPDYEIYHLSAGAQSQTYRELTTHLSRALGKSKPLYIPSLVGPFSSFVNRLARLRGTIGYGATLLKVFLPYLVWNTVFDNTRVVSETGRSPAPFSEYCAPLLKFSKEHHFTYPYREWPRAATESAPASAARETGR